MMAGLLVERRTLGEPADSSPSAEKGDAVLTVGSTSSSVTTELRFPGRAAAGRLLGNLSCHVRSAGLRSHKAGPVARAADVSDGRIVAAHRVIGSARWRLRHGSIYGRYHGSIYGRYRRCQVGTQPTGRTASVLTGAHGHPCPHLCLIEPRVPRALVHNERAVGAAEVVVLDRGCRIASGQLDEVDHPSEFWVRVSTGSCSAWQRVSNGLPE